ncbi:MAG TPA: sulfite exporter TauE/SafE family protein [Mycobacteriales bacterium]|nr:sulfite exporter TauE/SafE family protein [Mycobacteriales bacterium]
MTGLEELALAGAGLVAGAVNAAVGSGSLLTFPTLLAIGYPPVLANVSNTLGLIPGSVSGAIGYRRELVGQRRRILALLPAAVAGGLGGAALLLAIPGAFRDVVPALILVAVGLVLAQPRVARRRAARGAVAERPGPLLYGGVLLSAVYGGYFGAAMSVIVLGLLGLALDDDIQRLNGVKNVITAVVNAVAAVYFVVATDVAWVAVVLLWVSSAVGGQIGAHVGRRLPAPVLRLLVAVVGTAVAIQLLVSG